MTKNTITMEEIKREMDNAQLAAFTAFDKCTVVCMQFENGFIITESSACVDVANYDSKLGVDICKKRIENKLWELKGYALQEEVHNMEKYDDEE